MSTADSPSALSGLMAALFQSMAEPVLVCDRDLTILAANGAAAGLLAMPAGQLAGRKAVEVLAPCPAAGTDPLAPALRRQEWKCELHLAGGERRLLQISGIPLQDHRCAAHGWALTLREIPPVSSAPEFIGSSAAVQELLEFVIRIAASRATSILLLGESGTGKDVIARRLHALSSRAASPFIPINCAALPDALLESELFGYEKGAFTGATEARKGLLETAHGGTVLLDEIAEMSLPLQAKLLRVLEQHTFRRLGGSRDISVDLRVIGATNADLDRALREQRFRGDLYYRLNVVQIRLPALRERPEDIPELASHFLGCFNQVHHRHVRGIHPGAQRLLESHSWPGNVRELRNVIERAVLVEASEWITPGSLAIRGRPSAGAAASPPRDLSLSSPHLSLRGSEQELIAAALAEANGNQTRAAALLGIGRFSLRYKMKKLGILQEPRR